MRHRFVTVALSLLILGLAACGTSEPVTGPAGVESTGSLDGAAESSPSFALYGVIGNHVVVVDQTTGDATSVGATPNFSGIQGLTFHPDTGTLLGIGDPTTDPKLLSIDPATGLATVIGQIQLVNPQLDVRLAEAMAFNPDDGRLYAAVSELRPPFLSNRLVKIDPATGHAAHIARITGTAQDEADALVFVDGTLYGVDGTAGGTFLYTIDLATGVATRVGEGGADLAFNPETRTLFGSKTVSRVLIAISLGDGLATVIGTTHTPAEFDGEVMRALAVAPLVTKVDIDIKPGSDGNRFNCRSGRGMIPLAILTTPDFDATRVDHSTVRFSGAFETHANKGEAKRHEEDVDGDGDVDLVFHFRTEDTDLDCDSTEATLTGETVDGTGIEGSDSLESVG